MGSSSAGRPTRVTVLHTAEVSLARILGLTAAVARARIRDVVRDATPTEETPRQAPRGSLRAGIERASVRAIWRASQRHDGVRLLVELVGGDEVRVCQVLPAQPEAAEPAGPTRMQRAIAHRLRELGYDVRPAWLGDLAPVPWDAVVAWVDGRGVGPPPPCLAGRHGAAPLALRDRGGRIWEVTSAAVISYFEIARSLHPDLTREHARDEWPELLEHVHAVTKTPRHEVWRANAEYDRVYLDVEAIPGGYRVTGVRPAHQGTGAAAGSLAPRTPVPREPGGRMLPEKAHTTTDTSGGTAVLTRGHVRVVPAARLTATPAPEVPLPDVDAGVLLLVQHELVGGGYPSAVALASKLRVSIKEVRRALVVLAPPEPPSRRRRAVIDRVEVVVVRRGNGGR